MDNMFDVNLKWLILNTWFSNFLVARGQSDSEVDASESASEVVEENSDLGIVGDDVQDFGDESFSPAPGIDTICVFPKNSAKCENQDCTYIFFFFV